MASDIKVAIPCELGWNQVKGYDNTGNQNSTITLTVEVHKSIKISSLDFTRTISEKSIEEATKMGVETSVNASYGIVDASMSASIENSTTLKKFLSSTKEVTREHDLEESETTKEEFHIGAGDQLYFYQRVLKGPGISCALDITKVSFDPNLEDSWTDVEMTAITRPQRFIKHMGVKYGDGEAEAPDDHIRELNGLSSDINKGQEGKYVWMIPEWTYDTSEAATGFEIRIQDNAVAGWADLASGAGGKYRYVYTNHNQHDLLRVVDARLIRSESKLSADKQVEMLKKLGEGWVGGTRDINEGRGGSYLYLAYRLY